MSIAAAPADLKITPRNVVFERTQDMSRWWHGGDPISTTFYNALSLSFPAGEAYFVRSVRVYLEQLDETLRGQVGAFAQQEAFHSREHMAFNRQLTAAGYDTREIDELNRQDALKMQDAPPDLNVAATAALEHFTAILARALLSDERHCRDFPANLRSLWLWHSIEEVEHKGVAFDTFLYATRELSAFKRWLFRIMVMYKVTIDFWQERTRDLRLLFRQDGLDTPRTWRRLALFLFFKPGLLRHIFFAYLGYYLPGFHPWKHDDKALAARVEQTLNLEVAAKPA